MSTTKTLFITGVSSGLGKALAAQALAAGHKVIGTLREQSAIEAFEAQAPGRAHGVLLDVTEISAIDSVVNDVDTVYGPVDVLVNNAGYGQEGVFEESTLEEARQQFEVNVFGLIAVTKAFAPLFRQRRKGHIINITSMGGFITLPGVSLYHGTKFAIEGISESLGKELKPFNVFVTAVAPGGFRTDWAGRSMKRSPRHIKDYDASFDPVRKAREERSGKQPGDPVKAADAMLKLIDSPTPPAHLLLGSDAVKLVREKLAQLEVDIAAWETVSLSTDV